MTPNEFAEQVKGEGIRVRFVSPTQLTGMNFWTCEIYDITDATRKSTGTGRSLEDSFDAAMESWDHV